jgi:hypothetical protein
MSAKLVEPRMEGLAISSMMNVKTVTKHAAQEIFVCTLGLIAHKRKLTRLLPSYGTAK